MNINGVAAVVTGGAAGLGRATAARLASAGAKVAILDMSDNGDASARQIGASFFYCDVTNEASAVSALASAEKLDGPARILVNCAGIAPIGKTIGRENVPHPLNAFRKAIEVNLIGTFNIISKFAARLASESEVGEERGVIVNIASVAAFDGQVGQVAYAASKAGVAGMTLPIARDLAPHKIRVMAIAPGPFLTAMLEGLPQSVQDSLGSQIPHPARLGKPDEFAMLVQAIVENPMLNGEVIRLDGAIRLPPR